VSKNTWLALLVVIGLPVLSFFVVKYASENAVVMPRRYFPDADTSYVKDGKQYFDTLWHHIPDFTLTNQLQQQVSLHEFDGKIVVADFFFTRCPSFCPTLTKNMKRLQDAFVKTDTIVRFISFSVDPQRDSAAVLKKYADKYGINSDIWWLLTGPKETIYDMAQKDFKIAVADSGEYNFIHTDKFVLLDKERVVRGFYKGQDSMDMRRLADDIVLLMLEKDKRNKRTLFRK
jgi:protein SCO1/2